MSTTLSLRHSGNPAAGSQPRLSPNSRPGKLLDSGEREDMDVNVGDTVLFAKYGGTELNTDGKDLMILSLRDIHAVVLD